LGGGALRFIFSSVADSRFGFVLGDDFSSGNLAKSQYGARIAPAGKTGFGTTSAPHSPTGAESSFVEVGLQRFAVAISFILQSWTHSHLRNRVFYARVRAATKYKGEKTRFLATAA
jgi:hypothetical protein